ncbi:unnamed protein product [Rotaria sp. Silwood2]|nr:unnamed protein product [Rotaria sp. Silwood2]CAF4173456.1 unnamed protein product [Rotaria sp. Silwood2]
MNGTIKRSKIIYRSIPIIVLQNSSTIIGIRDTLNESTLPNIYLRNITLAQHIARHDHYDMNKTFKLVLRHAKTIGSMK